MPLQQVNLLLPCAAMLMVMLGCGETRRTPISDVGEFANWQLATPAEVGLSVAGLEQLRDYALTPEFNTQSVLIVKDGYLAAEWYAPGRDADSLGTSWSMAKSFAATLVGIALHQGAITHLDQSATTWFPEWTTSAAAQISLRDILAMAPGFKWDESATIDADLVSLSFSADQLGYATAQTVIAAPGQIWNYSSGTAMLLSRVLEVATGQPVADYARRHLFDPLGFTTAEWWTDGAGHVLTYCCINALSRDFVKLGQLYLQGGRWDGEQLFDAGWPELVASAHQSDNSGYGLHFWLNHPDGERYWPSVPTTAYFAQGHDHQFIGIFPEQQMVVFRNAWFTRPEGDTVAEAGLFADGMLLEGVGTTGTKRPAHNWDDGTFFTLAAAALE